MGEVDFRRLRTFHLVATGGSLQYAATRLRLTIPAISIQIRRLEKDLGVELFQRFGRKLVLTQLGDRFLQEVEPALLAVENAVDSVSTKTLTRSRVSVAIGNDVSHLVSDSISQFAMNNPHLDISLRVLRSQEIISLVLNCEADLGLGFFGKIPEDLEKQTFLTTGFSFVCSSKHPLAHRKSLTVEDLAQHRLVTLRQGTVLHKKIERVFSDAGIEPASIIETTSCHSSKVFAEAGVGVAVTHTACLGYEYSEQLRHLTFNHDLGQAEFTIIRRKARRLSPAHIDLIRCLRDMRCALSNTADRSDRIQEP